MWWLRAGETKDEAATLQLLIDLYKGRANMYDRVCELYHELLEALSAEEDARGVNTALLQLGQFRLQKHLADTATGSELVFAELEMTDMDLGGALEFFAAQVPRPRQLGLLLFVSEQAGEGCDSALCSTAALISRAHVLSFRRTRERGAGRRGEIERLVCLVCLNVLFAVCQ